MIGSTGSRPTKAVTQIAQPYVSNTYGWIVLVLEVSAQSALYAVSCRQFLTTAKRSCSFTPIFIRVTNYVEIYMVALLAVLLMRLTLKCL